MEAMVLAAGDGTRLRPLTDALPKALVPVRGRPLLAHVLDRLVAAGATRIVVNTCRHADQVEAWLATHAPPGVDIALSHEPDGPYETGGGLVAAKHLFRRGGPILLHNVDVLSRIPLDGLLAAHRAARAGAGERYVATLAVQDRPATRRLLFDDEGLAGRERRGDGAPEGETQRARPVRGTERSVAFAGIHVVEPAILDLARAGGAFSLRELYLDLVGRGCRIGAWDVTAHPWLDVGTPERLRAAEAGDW